MIDGDLYKLAAFSAAPGGGNPAGVWVGDELPEPSQMQAIAADVGYSETAFVAPREGLSRTIRYFSPQAEVSFCGHATIATGVVLGRESGAGDYVLSTIVGEVPVSVREQDGSFLAALTSVETRHKVVSDEVRRDVLTLLGWNDSDLDASIPVMSAYAGAWHLVLAAADKNRLATLDYDFNALRDLMLSEGLTTLQLVWRESNAIFHSRNPFPVGGVVEDPATGAAAAALGGYLRDAKLVESPFAFTIVQGEGMGRPSKLSVRVPEVGGIVVSGSAISIPG